MFFDCKMDTMDTMDGRRVRLICMVILTAEGPSGVGFSCSDVIYGFA